MTKQLIETTCPVTASHQHREWVKFRESRRVTDESVFVFTDGSSKGGYGAVVIHPGEQPSVVSGFTEMTSTRNVGAELNGALLGLRAVRPESKVVLVCDYMGIAAWLSENWKIKDPEVRSKIDAIREVIRENKLTVKYVHHRGHQRTDDDFTRFNTMADEASTLANQR